MRKCLFALLVASSGLYAQDVLKFDFSITPPSDVAKLDGHAVIENGIMKLPFIDKRGSTLEIMNPPAKPFLIEYKVRMLENNLAIKDKHFSIRFVCGKDKSLGVYSTGKNFFYILWENGENIYYKGGGKNIDFRNLDWKNIKVLVGEKYVEVLCDGKMAFQAPAELFPIKSIIFGVWRQSVEYDDMRITLLPEEKADFLDKPALSSNFDSSADLIDYEGKNLPPLNTNYTFEPGVSGESMKAQKGTRLEYSVNDIFRNKAGGIMFWIKADRDNFSGPLLRCTDKTGNDCLSIDAKPNALVATFKRKEGAPLSYQLPMMAYWSKSRHNWVHCAVTWNDDVIRLFINGLPYAPAHGTRKLVHLVNKDLENISELKFFHNVQFDDPRIFRRPVTNQDVYQEYRSKMPIDIVMQKQMFDASYPVKLSFQIAPGGFHMHPMPVPQNFRCADVELTATLFGDKGKGKVILRKTEKLSVDKAMDFVLPEKKLSPGNYLLKVDVKTNESTFTRCFHIDIAVPVSKLVPTNTDYEKGALIYEEIFENPKDPKYFTDGTLKKITKDGMTYFEAGSNRLNRFSFEVPFPQNTLGKPVLIEMRWPDNHPRMMGHYIYCPSKGYCDRDRLQQGIQSGIEYPLTNKMVTTKYIFWPGFENYLFEFRTMATGMPAAIASIKIYEIKGALPALKVNEPAELPARKIGYMDEDQTFDTNLNKDWYRNNHEKYINRDAFVFDELVKYLDYTGQNTFHYPLLRYWFCFYQYEGNMGRGNLPPTKIGGVNYMVDTLAKHGIHFTAILNMSSMPEIANASIVDSDIIDQDMFMSDKNGKNSLWFTQMPLPNYATNPEVIRLYNQHILETAKLLKDSPSVDGFEIWKNPWGATLDYGYGDYTINKFTADTGIQVPTTGRYEFLTGEKRKEWTQWRADQTTKFIRNIRETLDQVNPDWKLYYVVYDRGTKHNNINILPKEKDEALEKEKLFLEEQSVDLNGINSIRNTTVIPMRSPTLPRWYIHHYGKDSAMDDFNYSWEANNQTFRKYGKAIPLSNVYMIYYENMEMKKTQYPEKYSSFFQNADIKPHGRYWLKELAFNVASMDTLEITIGGQPLGTLGREDEAREFTKAYRALPALSFTDVPGADDPVTVRYLNTQNGTYFYLASLLYSPCKVKLEFSQKVSYKDLSTGETLTDDEIKLNSYQLRSFLIPNQEVTIQSAKVFVPNDTKEFYAKRLDKLKQALDTLQEVDDSTFAKEKDTIARVTRLLKNGHYAEAHRLLFSLETRSFIKKAANAKLVAKQNQMMKQGHIAVNCGSSEYYQAPGGEVFFPDQKFNSETSYGYLGADSRTAVRDIANLKETRVPELFRTENYDLDAYQFKVPNGTYKLRLYMRFAYKPSYKPDFLIVSAKAQGNFLFEKLDLYKANNGDFDKPVIFEFDNIEVQNGLLSVDFIPEKNPKNQWNKTIRHVTGIEVIKQ